MTKPGLVRRIEVFTGMGHRRSWSDEDKARIVAESYGSVESVSAVARRYGLASSQLFGWRREARKLMSPPAPSAFASVVVEPNAVEPSPVRPRRGRSSSGKAGVIELEIGGVAMRVSRWADARTIAAVIRALKATS